MTDKSRVLIVDDSEANLLAFRAVLESLDHEIFSASSGPQALKLAAKHEFSAILLDARMPGMDGFDTAALLRLIPANASTPIIFISAYDHTRDHIGRGYRAGATEFLISPVEPDLLKFKISAFVELSRMHRAMKDRADRLMTIIQSLGDAVRKCQGASDLSPRVEELEKAFESLKADITQVS